MNDENAVVISFNQVSCKNGIFLMFFHIVNLFVSQIIYMLPHKYQNGCL